MASDLGLHCLPMSHKKDARLYVNTLILIGPLLATAGIHDFNKLVGLKKLYLV